jgi:transcription factor-like protein
MAIRACRRNDTLFVLSGIAVRLARKMGLHRDGTSLGLSPFETEMRRRLWWHIVHVDFRTSDVIGAKPSLDLFDGDTTMPLNVADEDLSPNMVNPPPERNGITPIAICRIRCEIIDFMRKFSTSAPSDVRLEMLTSSDITISKKDSMISQIEDLLERKYLRYCDPSQSLHNFVSIMIRTAICKMKLFAHNPRQFASQGIELPQIERELIFSHATKLLEYIVLLKGNPTLEKYSWHIGTSHLWNTILCVLIEARHCKTGPEIDRVWPLIGVVFSKYPQMFDESAGVVFSTLGKWTLQVWDEYVTTMKIEGLPEPATPEYIKAIRCCRRSPDDPSKSNAPVESSLVYANSTGFTRIQSPEQNGNSISGFDTFASYDISEWLSFEMDPSEWVRWV